MIYDVVIVGAGLFGVSTAYELLKQGKKVLVLDSKEIGQGASKGAARMSKEDPRAPHFNQMVEASQKTISELEDNPDDPILREIPCFDVCEPGHPLIDTYNAQLEDTACRNSKERFGVAPKGNNVLYAYKEKTRLLNPDRLLKSLLAKCQGFQGFQICTGEQYKISAWKECDNGVKVITQGGVYEADKMVIAAHGWSRNLLQNGNITVHNDITEGTYTKRAPVWNIPWPDGVQRAIGRSSLPGELYLDIYYLPEFKNGKWTMKIGVNSDRDRNKQYNSPDEISYTVTAYETESMKTLFSKRFGFDPFEGLDEKDITSSICHMTYTKKVVGDKFPSPLIGPVVDEDGKTHDSIHIACAGCGIGAKLCPEIGKIAAEILADPARQHPFLPCRMTRSFSLEHVSVDNKVAPACLPVSP